MENDNEENLEDNKTDNSSEQQETIQLSSKVVWFTFGLILAVSICPALDGGIIPASDTDIMRDLNIKQANFGLFSSGEYFGRLFGSILFTIIIGKCNRKYLLTATLIFKSLCVIVPVFTFKYLPNLAARIASGAGQVFFNIYMPIWCDQYGLVQHRTIMVTLTSLGNPVGVLLGFGFQTLIKRWYWCFAIEGILMVALAIIFLFSPSLYYTVNLELKEGTQTYEAYLKKNNEEDYKPCCEKTKEFMKNLKIILSNPIFIFSGLANALEMFGVDIIQFWGKNYMEQVIGITNPTLKFILFGFICAFGPPIGFILGGFTGSYVGGYAKKWCIVLCVVYSFICGIFGTFSIFPRTGWGLAVVLWAYLLFDCACVPLTIGIVIHSLPNHLKGDGFSVVNFIINLVGNFPSAFIYGLIDEHTKYKKLAMVSCLSVAYIGFIFTVISMGFRFRIKDEDENTNNNEDSLSKISGIVPNDDKD